MRLREEYPQYDIGTGDTDLSDHAELIRTELLAGRPVLYNFAPHNGTLYRLVFTPLTGTLHQFSDVGSDTGWPAPDQDVLVTWVGMKADTFHLLSRKTDRYLHPEYVREKLGGSISDAIVLTEVLEAIAGIERESLEVADV